MSNKFKDPTKTYVDEFQTVAEQKPETMISQMMTRTGTGRQQRVTKNVVDLARSSSPQPQIIPSQEHTKVQAGPQPKLPDQNSKQIQHLQIPKVMVVADPSAIKKPELPTKSPQLSPCSDEELRIRRRSVGLQNNKELINQTKSTKELSNELRGKFTKYLQNDEDSPYKAAYDYSNGQKRNKDEDDLDLAKMAHVLKEADQFETTSPLTSANSQQKKMDVKQTQKAKSESNLNMATQIKSPTVSKAKQSVLHQTKTESSLSKRKRKSKRSKVKISPRRNRAS